MVTDQFLPVSNIISGKQPALQSSGGVAHAGMFPSYCRSISPPYLRGFAAEEGVGGELGLAQGLDVGEGG